MKQGESDVELRISIQGIHLSAFGNYVWKSEGSFNNDTYFPSLYVQFDGKRVTHFRQSPFIIS